MLVQITTEVLDALNLNQHDLVAVRRARAILEAAGCEVECHPAELNEAKRLRDLARKMLLEADALDGRDSEIQMLE